MLQNFVWPVNSQTGHTLFLRLEMTSLLNYIHLIYLLLYFVIAGQAIFYQLCFARVFAEIPSSHFLLIRRIADPILDKPLTIVYYGSIACGIFFMLLNFYDGVAETIFMSTAVFLFLVLDIILAKQKSIPLNTRIRDTNNINDENAKRLQLAWIYWIRVRGLIGISGFLLLLILRFTVW